MVEKFDSVALINYLNFMAKNCMRQKFFTIKAVTGVSLQKSCPAALKNFAKFTGKLAAGLQLY